DRLDRSGISPPSEVDDGLLRRSVERDDLFVDLIANPVAVKEFLDLGELALRQRDVGPGHTFGQDAKWLPGRRVDHRSSSVPPRRSMSEAVDQPAIPARTGRIAATRSPRRRYAPDSH